MFVHNNPYLAHCPAIDVDIYNEVCKEVRAEMKEPGRKIWEEHMQQQNSGNAVHK